MRSNLYFLKQNGKSKLITDIEKFVVIVLLLSVVINMN